MTAGDAASAPPDPFAGPGWSPEQSGRVRVRRRPRRRQRALRRLVIGGGALALLVLLAGAWLAWNAIHARSQLTLVRADVQHLQAQVDAGDMAGARDTSTALRAHADAAHSYIDSPIWDLGEHLPVVGAKLASAGTLTTIVDDLARNALPRLVDAADVLAPQRLREADGSIDLDAITHVTPGLAEARSTFADAVTALQHMSTSGWRTVESARHELLTHVVALDKTVRSAQTAARLAPPLLGASGPRSYMLTFQNDAEMRATGGLPGAFAIVQISRGRFQFVRFESDGYLVGTPATGVDFGSGYDQLYGTSSNGARVEYRNTNLSPNYPYAAQLWLAMWRHKTGQQLDGAMAIDPTALSYLLAASGPATMPDGSTVSADNVVADTQSTLYERFATDNAARKQYLLDVARAVSHKIVGPGVDLTALIHGGAKAVSQQRLLLWVRDPHIEAQLAALPIGGVEPASSDPYFRLALWNSTASKLDYYIHASVDYATSGCAGKRHVTVTVRLTNNAPEGLPAYVLGATADKQFHIPPGDEYLGILAYGTRGALLSGYSADGHSVEPAQFVELGHPVWSDGQFVRRGHTLMIVYHLTERVSAVAPDVPAQPMVNPMDVTVRSVACRS